jgi:hypothetical protein
MNEKSCRAADSGQGDQTPQDLISAILLAKAVRTSNLEPTLTSPLNDKGFLVLTLSLNWKWLELLSVPLSNELVGVVLKLLLDRIPAALVEVATVYQA